MKKRNKAAVMALALLTLGGIIFLPDAKGESSKLCAVHYGVQRIVSFIEQQLSPVETATSIVP